MRDALPIALFFGLSLLGAVVLFRFFKSSALVKRKTYQAGGAIAGFIIIYGALFTSYYQVNRLENGKYRELNVQYERMLRGATLSGKVGPDTRPLRILLAVATTQPDSSGHFKINVPYVLLDEVSSAAVYALPDDDHAILDPNCGDGQECEIHDMFLNVTGSDNINIENMRLKKRKE